MFLRIMANANTDLLIKKKVSVQEDLIIQKIQSKNDKKLEMEILGEDYIVEYKTNNKPKDISNNPGPTRDIEHIPSDYSDPENDGSKDDKKDCFKTSPKFLTEAMKVIRLVYLYEEEYKISQNNNSQFDYNNLFDLIMSLVENSILEEQNTFAFYPEFYKRALDILKVELGKNVRLVEELLNFLQKALVNQTKSYLDENGLLAKMGVEQYLKFLNQIVSTLDSIFVEQPRSHFNQNHSLTNIAKIILEHSIWELMLEWCDKKHMILMLNLTVLFDDIMNELPENILENTLMYFYDNDIILHF